MEKELLTAKEAAEYLRISMPQIYKLVRQKKVPSLRLEDKILFRKSTLDTFLDNLEKQTS